MGKKKDLFGKLEEELRKISNKTVAAVATVKNEVEKQTSGGTGKTPQKTSEKTTAKQSNVITPTTRQTTPRSADAWTWREPSSEDQERAKRQKSQITPTAITYQERQRVKEIQEDPRRVQAVTPTVITHQERQTARAAQDARLNDAARSAAGYQWLIDTMEGQAKSLQTQLGAQEAKNAQIASEKNRASTWARRAAGLGGDKYKTKAEEADRKLSAGKAEADRIQMEIDALEAQIDQAKRGKAVAEREPLRRNPDFREKSHQLPEPNVTPTDAEPYFFDLLYYAVNDLPMPSGRRKAQDVMADKGYTYRDVPDETRDMFNYLYVEEGREAAKQYIEDAMDRSFTWGGSLGQGFVQGSGLGGLIDLGTGGKRARQNRQLVAQAQEDHPFAFGTGQVGGATAQWVATKKLVGGLPGVRALGPVANDMVSTGVSAAAGDAARNISPLMTGDLTPNDYALSMLANGAGGATGSAAARGVTALGTKALFKTGFQNNIFANAVNQGLGGAAFTVTNVGTRAVIDPNYNPTGEELARDAAVSFAFQTIGSALRLGAQTKQAKAELDNEAAALKRDLYRMAEAKKAGVVTDTDLVDAMRARSARLRNTLNSTQYIGHGKEVKDALAFLDQFDDFVAGAETYKLAAKLTDAMVGKETIGDKSLGQLYQENAMAGQLAARKTDATSQSAEAKDVSLLLERALEARPETSASVSEPDEALKALAKRYGIEYTNSPRYDLLKSYSASVESGWLSPLVDFPLYEDYYQKIEDRVIGQVVGDVEIKGQAQHFLERVFGCMEDPSTGRPRTGVTLEDVFDCIENPVRIEPIIIDENGRPSFRVVGRNVRISINPNTGNLIQVNPRGKSNG